MVDCTSHMKVADWPGNTEVSINPMTVSVSYKKKKNDIKHWVFGELKLVC